MTTAAAAERTASVRERVTGGGTQPNSPNITNNSKIGVAKRTAMRIMDKDTWIRVNSRRQKWPLLSCRAWRYDARGASTATAGNRISVRNAATTRARPTTIIMVRYRAAAAAYPEP